MTWNTLFAARTAHMKRSPVRELLKLTAHPEIISFAGGLPAAELFPMDHLAAAAAAVLKERGRPALQYGPTEGLPELRDWIANRFSAPGLRLSPANVAITSGAQQGLDLLGRVLLDPGDRVLVENPTYLALLSAWRPLGVEFVPVPCDARGLRIEDVEPLLSKRPKLLYTIPNFQNPQGTTLDLARRRELVRLAAEHQFGMVEDNPYGELRYDGEALPNLFSLDTGKLSTDECHTLYVGTFSKVLMPGLRIGWVVAPERVIEKLVQAKQSADLHTSNFNQDLAWELVQDNFLERHIPLLKKHYRERRDAMLAALERHMPEGVSWTRPAGGMFLMLSLPGGIEGQQLLRRALERGVAFVPGGDFHLDESGRNRIRLNFSQASPDRIETGIRRLAELVTDREPVRALPRGLAALANQP